MIVKKITKKIIYSGILVAVFFVFFMNVSFSQATPNLNDWRSILEEGGGPDGAGYRTDVISPEPMIAIVIKLALSFLGVIFLILMVYGGYLWMTARGKEDQVNKARDLIIAAVIGLIIVIASYAISNFVVDALTKTTLSF